MTPMSNDNNVMSGPVMTRNKTPEQFMRFMDQHGVEGKETVRDALSIMDGGRFHPILESTHKWLSHMDFEGRKHAHELVNDDLLAWVNVYGRSEDLATFEAR